MHSKLQSGFKLPLWRLELGVQRRFRDSGRSGNPASAWGLWGFFFGCRMQVMIRDCLAVSARMFETILKSSNPTIWENSFDYRITELESIAAKVKMPEALKANNPGPSGVDCGFSYQPRSGLNINKPHYLKQLDQFTVIKSSLSLIAIWIQVFSIQPAPGLIFKLFIYRRWNCGYWIWTALRFILMFSFQYFIYVSNTHKMCPARTLWVEGVRAQRNQNQFTLCQLADRGRNIDFKGILETVLMIPDTH